MSSQILRNGDLGHRKRAARAGLTMKIRIPALLSVATTTGISSRGGSTMPTMPTRVRPDLAWRDTSSSKEPSVVCDSNCPCVKVFLARRITRLP